MSNRIYENCLSRTVIVKIRYLSTLLLMSFLSLASGLAVQAGEIIGRLNAPDKSPVPNAWVGALGTSTKEGQTKMVAYETMSTVKGEFAFKSLPDGIYRICVSKPHVGLLNPCDWGSQRYDVVVNSTQRTFTIDIPVRFGRQLRVTVDDIRQTLSTSAAKGVPDALIGLSVLDNEGNEQEMRLDYTGKKTRDYILTVPADEDLQLIVSSFEANIKLAQSQQSRQPLSKNHHRIPIQITSGEPVEKILRLEVSKVEK